MSRNVLEGKNTHDYLDDLESFYFVLMSIIVLFNGPNSPKREPPDDIRRFAGERALAQKTSHFLQTRFSLEITDWFGAPFRNLASRLQSLFGTRLRNARLAEFDGENAPPVEPMKDSDEFLACVRQAIADVEHEDNLADTLAGIPLPAKSSGIPENVPRASDDEDPSRPKKRARLGIRRSAASSRPKRKTANYGLPVGRKH